MARGILTMTSLAGLASVGALGCRGGPAAVGICVERVPHPLLKGLAKEYPGYRLPLEGDFEPEDFKWLKKDNGGCFGVTGGDFDGDSRQDLALFLKDKKTPRLILVAAVRQSGDSWRLTELPTDCDTTAENLCFLKTVKPGHYVQDQSGPDPDGLLELQLPHEGVDMVDETGDVERDVGQRVYGLVGGRWLHIQVR
jgi:hypothetical protein